MVVEWWSNGGRMMVEWWSNGGRMVVEWWSNGGRMVLVWVVSIVNVESNHIQQPNHRGEHRTEITPTNSR